MGAGAVSMKAWPAETAPQAIESVKRDVAAAPVVEEAAAAKP